VASSAWGYAGPPLSQSVDGQASGPRATLALVALGAVTLIIACIAIRDAVLWYSAPTPGLLVEPGGAVSNVGLPHWAGRRAGLQYPSRIASAGDEDFAGGSRTWVRRWDAAVKQARNQPHLDAVVDTGSERRRVRLPMTPLEPLAWWVYAGTSLFGGFLYTSAALLALWASPHGALSRAFTKFAATGGLFSFSFFDIHTERTLTPVFFLTYSYMPAAMIVLLANLPEPTAWVRRYRWALPGLEALSLSLGVSATLTLHADGDVRPLQGFVGMLMGLALLTFVIGFVYRYARSRGEQRNTLRVLLLSTVPPYAGLAGFTVLGSWGFRAEFPDYLVWPPLVLLPLASFYAFVRFDLWGSRALLSRIGTHVFVAALASAVAIGSGTGLATWMGATFRDALVGAAAGGIAATLMVVTALRLSDVTLFRSRAEYKPTIDRLSEDLTTLTSPEEVARAIERTVRRWLPCDYLQLTRAVRVPRPSSIPPPSNRDTDEAHPESKDAERGARVPPRASEADLRLQVAFGGKPFGWLDVGRKRGGALFTSDDIDLLRTIANHGGLALAHAEAYQELEQRRRQQAEAWRGEREALVETVAAEIAHEIRYPINYFRTLFERSAKSIKLTDDDIDIGREEVDRLERLVSGLKRMAAHRIERTPTAVSELCARAEALLSDSLDRRRIELELGRNATLRCDPDKMTQVVTNLLANALEACGPNGRVGISWSAVANGGELSVWDDGPGFVGDPARLFAPWYTTKPRGTGLGLAITHRLVRAHGWSIAAQRREVRTLFTVSVRGEDVVRDSDDAKSAEPSEVRVA
jgi:signal transduction histidine kinase